MWEQALLSSNPQNISDWGEIKALTVIGKIDGQYFLTHIVTLTSSERNENTVTFAENRQD